MGKFAYCTDSAVLLRTECGGTFVDGETGDELARVWVNPEFGHFDDLPNAALTLFEMSGFEMFAGHELETREPLRGRRSSPRSFRHRWPNVMYWAMDSYAWEEAPRRDASPAVAIFFVVWIFVGALFVNNLVVGVVIDNFNQISQQENGSAFLTDDQRAWVDTVFRATAVKPKPTHRPDARWRRWLWELIRSSKFEAAIMISIIANITMMGTFHVVPDADAGACVVDATWQAVWRNSNFVFFGIYAIEMFLKLAALGQFYFVDPWNLFDFALVLTSAVDVFVQEAALADQVDFSPSGGERISTRPPRASPRSDVPLPAPPGRL